MAKNDKVDDVKTKLDTETIKVVESGVIESSVPADINKPGTVRKVGTTLIQTF